MLTLAQVALIDILSDRIITMVGIMKTVPGMAEEEVDAEKKKWEDMSDSEMDRLDNH